MLHKNVWLNNSLKIKKIHKHVISLEKSQKYTTLRKLTKKGKKKVCI